MRSNMRTYPVSAAVLLIASSIAIALAGCAPESHAQPAQLVGDQSWTGEPLASGTSYQIVAKSADALFPATLAVVRVKPALHPTSAPADGGARFEAWDLRTVDARYWTGLMTNVPEVQEVAILDRDALQQSDADLSRIAAAARRVKANLCFVYGLTADVPNAYRMTGLLLDATNASPVATIAAEAGPADYTERAPDRHSTDERHCDAAQLCARKLEQQVRACLLELIARNHPAAPKASPWKGNPGRPGPQGPAVIVVPEQSPSRGTPVIVVPE